MNGHDLPEGIEVDIMSSAGVAQESFTEYGRSVRFTEGTCYWIRITNHANKHVALNLYIDGRKVKLTPILLYRVGRRRGRPRAKNIYGFEMSRDSVELDNDEFETTSTYEEFVTRRPASASTTSHDHRIGTIKFEFFATKYITRQPGSAQQLRATLAPLVQHNARRGVLATGTVANRRLLETCGKHYSGEEKRGRRPLADTSRPLDPASFEITICEL